MAVQQRKKLTQDTWLTDQLNQAFEKLDSGNASFADHHTAKTQMAARKAKIRNQDQE